MLSICYDVETSGFLTPRLYEMKEIVLPREWVGGRWIKEETMLVPTGEYLPEPLKLHCLVCVIVETSEVFVFRDAPGYLPVSDGIELLMSADECLGHNIKAYDNKVLQRFYPDFEPKNVVDTLEMCKAFFSVDDLKALDEPLIANGLLDAELRGKHSLRAWSQRCGNAKLEYTGDFQTFDPSLLTYCIQDVRANISVYQFLSDYIDSL